jgi:hypothetical protein
MGAPSSERMGIVKALIETAPDGAVRQLDAALKSDSGGSLAAVRAMVEDEVRDRRVRDAVFAPLLPLFTSRTDGFEQVVFPAAVLPRVWRALKQTQPKLIALALANLGVPETSYNAFPAFEQLCSEAAAALHNGDPAFAPVTQLLEETRPGLALQFAGYLAITPLARRATAKLPAWIRNMNGDHTAAVRLIFKDAVAISDDATPNLIEILLGQLSEPWTVLRIMAAVMNHAGDRYVSSSEMAGFCERILANIDRQVNLVRQFDYDGGPDAAVKAAKAVQLAVIQIAEFENALDLDKEGAWGQRIGRQKGAVASLTEGYLKKCSKVVSDALPMQPVRVGGSTVRSEPRLDAPPEPRAVNRAMASLTFFDSVRVSAAQGGYGTVRGKVCEDITHGLDGYLEELLAMLHGGEIHNIDIAHAYLEVLAGFMGLVQGEKAAQIVRRRAAAV